MVLGCYYLTLEQEGGTEPKKRFMDFNEAIMAWETGCLALHEPIVVRNEGEYLTTTVGRVMFNEKLPPELRFINRVINRRELEPDCSSLLPLAWQCRYGRDAGWFESAGLRFQHRAGTTIAISDIEVPVEKRTILAKAEIWWKKSTAIQARATD